MNAMLEARPTNLVIRDATAEDMADVARIYANYVLRSLATFEEAPPGEQDLRTRRAAIIAAGQPYLIAEVAGEPVGYAYAAAYRIRPAYRYTVEDSVYVAEQWFRRGIGLALLERLIGRCEAGPWRQMIAVIGDSANVGSIELHRRCGFAMVGTFRSVGYKLGRWVDTVLMQRPLGAGEHCAPE